MGKAYKLSKELTDIKDAVKKYELKHKSNVVFIGAFTAFKGKEFSVIDDTIFAYGDKESLIINLETMIKQIKKDKEDFINW